MSNSAFKMRGFSGFGSSPIKDYRKSLQYKLSGKAGRAKMDAKYASGESTKLQKDVKSAGSQIDKAIQGFFNNPRSKAAGGDVKTYVPPKKGIASGGSSGGSGGGFKPVTFKGKKGDPYSYRTTKDGGYEYSTDGKKFTKATNKKAIEAISKIAPTKIKKKK